MRKGRIPMLFLRTAFALVNATNRSMGPMICVASVALAATE